jgi:sugar phosphate isomerase/epimerase
MNDIPPWLLCSTGAFSHWPCGENQAALAYGPQLEVGGFELMFDPAWYANIERVAGDLKRSSLAFPVVHADKRIGVALGKGDRAAPALLEANCQLATMLGAQLLVLHLWGGPDLDSNLERNLAQLRTCLEIAQRYDTALAIETLPCRRADPLSNVLAAIACDGRSQVALDTEFLAHHHQLDEVFAVDRLWGEKRVCHVHIKDADGQRFAPDGRRNYLQPGEGRIDFVSFFSQLRQKGFSGTISLEAPATAPSASGRINQLSASLEFIRRMWGRSGTW